MNSYKDAFNQPANANSDTEPPKSLSRPICQEQDNKAMPMLNFDAKNFRHHFDSDEEFESAQEYLRVMWNVFHTFVDIGYGLDGVQLVVDEQERKLLLQTPDSGNVLKPKNSQSDD